MTEREGDSPVSTQDRLPWIAPRISEIPLNKSGQSGSPS
jgi:hypothetical protein